MRKAILPVGSSVSEVNPVPAGTWADLDLSNAPRPTRTLVGVSNAPLQFPESLYEGWSPPCASIEEECLVNRVSMTHRPAGQEYYSIDVDRFCIYRPQQQPRRPGEMTTLDILTIEHAVDTLYFEAVVTMNEEKFFLKDVPFSILAVDGYGDRTIHSTSAGLSLQSPLAAQHHVWYRLCQPAPDYERYHNDFIWISDLAKYTLEYLDHNSDSKVTVHDFKDHFYAWLKESYGVHISSWLLRYGRKDFRQAVAAHIHYIWKEAFSVNPSLRRHGIWNDCMLFETIKSVRGDQMPTIVTPFVYNIFQHVHFGKLLRAEAPSTSQERRQKQRRLLLRLTPLDSVSSPPPPMKSTSVVDVHPGDAVIIKPDFTKGWTTDNFWVAYVQDMRLWKDGVTTKLDLLWLYKAADNTLRNALYPFKNELFLSDNCSCGRDAYDLQDVVAKVNVSWYCRDPASVKGHNRYAVRQTYLTGAHEFTTLKHGHFKCRCREQPFNAMHDAMAEYRPGDFALIRRGVYHGSEGRFTNCEKDILEPVQILGFRSQISRIAMRVLLRAERDRQVSGAAPNELIWTEQVIHLPAYHLVRKCTVEGFDSRNAVTALYRRGGTGDLFYFIHNGHPPKTSAPKHEPQVAKLRGMGICCGGGSYDRGLEDGGAVEFKHVIDVEAAALHTYRANTAKPDEVEFFLGPMEKYLKDCLTDLKLSAAHAQIGEIDVIAAGSPCQGFSVMQQDKLSEHSMKQASLVANVLAYIDYYMPLYVLLENVIGMGSVIKGQDQGQNVLSQALSTLVGLGYQVQQFVIDAPVVGSFSSRARVFICATAPGLTPLTRPPQTHLTRKSKRQTRPFRLGKLANGLMFEASVDELSPFPMVTFDEATKDLPDIDDGHTQHCISWPDHHPGALIPTLMRDMITMIPQVPRGMGMAQSHALGRLGKPQQDKWFRNKKRAAPHSRSFMRVQPDWVVGAITTAIRPLDAFVGMALHPHQNRLLTVMEARRAQGFPDDEVILGSRAQKWRIIGNSVHRYVAFALGMSLKNAFEQDRAEVEHLWQSSRVFNSSRPPDVRVEPVIIIDNDRWQREVLPKSRSMSGPKRAHSAVWTKEERQSKRQRHTVDLRVLNVAPATSPYPAMSLGAAVQAKAHNKYISHPSDAVSAQPEDRELVAVSIDEQAPEWLDSWLQSESSMSTDNSLGEAPDEVGLFPTTTSGAAEHCISDDSAHERQAVEQSISGLLTTTREILEDHTTETSYEHQPRIMSPSWLLADHIAENAIAETVETTVISTTTTTVRTVSTRVRPGSGGSAWSA